MVVKVLEKNASEPRLDALREHVMLPVSIVDDALGTFVLNRQFSWFEGTVDWLDDQCRIYLRTDEEDGETAENAFAHLKYHHDRNRRAHCRRCKHRPVRVKLVCDKGLLSLLSV